MAEWAEMILICGKGLTATEVSERLSNWLARRPRFHLHFAPTSASWLNAAESWLSQLERRLLDRDSFCSVDEL